MELSERLREIRIRRELTQEQIAAVLKTTRQQYGKYETGVQEIPVRHIATLARYYNLSADYLIALTDMPHACPK